MTLKSVYYLNYKDCNHIATENEKGTIQISHLNPQFIDLYIQFRNKAINAISESVELLKASEVENQRISSLYFESFIYNWISFNSIYSFYGQIQDKERKKIKNIYDKNEANRRFIIDRIHLLINNDDFYSLVESRFFNNGNETTSKDESEFFRKENTLWLFDVFNLNQDYPGINNKFYYAWEFYDFFTWRLNRIRNFLFHGKKSIINERDSHIVESGAKLLNYFLNVFELEFLKNIKIKD